jgi:hypothetical protein
VLLFLRFEQWDGSTEARARLPVDYQMVLGNLADLQVNFFMRSEKGILQ